MQYLRSHLYFYPEHRDHDPQIGANGYGDVYPANTPYMIISQGSSGSDRVFMNAVGVTLAAFRPEVKEKLAKSGTLMAAVQMIFRSSNKNVMTTENYLTGVAHPTVFDGKQINEEIMVKMAHSMTTDALPPMVQLKVVEEDESVPGRDYFDVGARERLFDTPCAIARVVKSTKYARRMVVSAEASKDLDGKPLTYHWVLLRGDPERVRVKKLNDAGSQAELVVDYHSRRPIAPGSDMTSDRVDIGVFVHNGQYYSARDSSASTTWPMRSVSTMTNGASWWLTTRIQSSRTTMSIQRSTFAKIGATSTRMRTTAACWGGRGFAAPKVSNSPRTAN